MGATRILIVDGKMICGGVEAFIMNIYRHVDRGKIQFDFLVHYKDPCFYDKEIEALGGKIYRLSFRNDHNYFKYIRDLNDFFKMHPEYRVVWGHMDGLARIYLSVAKKWGRTTIAHSHITSSEHSLKGLVKRILRKNVYRYADFRFACSSEAGRYLYGKHEFRLIPNAIDTGRFAYSPETRERIREENGWGADELVIGHVGRFNEQKNHPYLIDIFEQVAHKNPRCRLCLCGDGELREKIREEVARRGLSDKVLFKGNIPNVNEYYQAFDVFVLPSLYEGLPVSGIEAQTSGLFCLFADTITRETEVVKGNALFLPIKGHPEVWAEHILSVAGRERQNREPDVIAAGYSILHEAKLLEEFLLNQYNEQHNCQASE